MSALAGWLFEHDGAVALGQVAAFLVCLAIAAGPLLRAWREIDRKVRAGLLCTGVAATLVSSLAFRLSRYEALGHEASYFECFQGIAPPGNAQGWPPFMTYPMLRWAFWAAGAAFGRDSGPVPLLALEALSRGVSVVLFGWFCFALARRAGPALAGAVLLALHPVHAFWAATLYNVTVPWALAVTSALAATLAWRSADGRLLLLAAAAGALVVATRVEWGLLAPALAILLGLGLGPGWGRAAGIRRPRFWLPASLLAVALGASLLGLGGSLTEQGGYHGIGGYVESIGRQGLFLRVLLPWHQPWMLAVVALGLWTWSREPGIGKRGPAGLAGFALLCHLALATFNDYEGRHALLPGMALLASASMAALSLPGRVRLAIAASVGLAVAVAGSVATLAIGASRYYAPGEAFRARAPGFDGPRIEPSSIEDGTCYLVTDDERLWSLGLAGSQFNLMEPGEAVLHWRSHGGCILWLFDNSQWRWDGLAARVRGEKLRYWFEWERRGWVSMPHDGLDAVVYRMASPPWGIGDADPLPPTEFVLPRAGEGADVPESTDD